MSAMFQGKNHHKRDAVVSHAGRDLVLCRLDLNITPDEHSSAEDVGRPAYHQDQDASLLFVKFATPTRPPES
jgi:hypothetical protein